MDFKMRGGTVPLAMQTGSGVPSAPASVQQEGRRGLGGGRDACSQQHTLLSTGPTSCHTHTKRCVHVAFVYLQDV